MLWTPSASLQPIRTRQREYVRIQHNDGSTDGCNGYVISPEVEHQVERRNLERDEKRLVQEEVPASHESWEVVRPRGIEDLPSQQNAYQAHHRPNGLRVE